MKLEDKVNRLLDVCNDMEDLEKRINKLRGERDQIVEQLHVAGYSWRTLAGWTGVSHVALQKRHHVTPNTARDNLEELTELQTCYSTTPVAAEPHEGW